MNAKLKIVFKIVYILLAFAFMAYYLITNWAQLLKHDWQPYPLLFIPAIILFWAAILGPVLVFKILFKKIADYNFRFVQMFRIFNLSFIGRYLPGKVWSVVGMVHYTGEYGIDRRLSLAVIVVNEVCYKASGLLWGSIYFALTEREGILPYVSFSAMIIGLIIIHPRILNRIVNFISKLFKKDRVELNIDYLSIIGIFSAYFLFWGIYGAGFYTLTQVVGKGGPFNSLEIISFFPLAWTAGNLAIFVPGGIGVREGMLVLLLSQYMALETALVITILQRILTTLIEGSNALASLAIKK